MTDSQKQLTPKTKFDLSTPFSDPDVRRSLVHPRARSVFVRRLQEQGFSADSNMGQYNGRSAMCHALTAAEDELEMLDRQLESVVLARRVLQRARRQLEAGLR